MRIRDYGVVVGAMGTKAPYRLKHPNPLPSYLFPLPSYLFSISND